MNAQEHYEYDPAERQREKEAERRESPRFNFENMVRAVVRTAHRFNDEHMSGKPLWFAVAERCGVGSTSAIALCRRFGVDPEAIVEKTRWEKVAELCGKEMDDETQGPSETCCKMWQHIEDNAPSM